MNYTHVLSICLLILLGIRAEAQTTTFWEDDFETHKGWILDAGSKNFQIAKPSGGNGDHGNANPTSGYNSETALISNLRGAYENNLSERAYQAISPEIDCSGKKNVSLKYMRWLNVEQNTFDNAYIDVYDGSIWHEKVWSNGNTITENYWTAQSIDISHLVDGKDKVRIRFTLGPTDSGWYYSGWNIDNVELTTKPDPVYGDFRTGDNRDWSSWWQEYNGRSWDWTREGPGETRNANVVTIRRGHRTTMNQNRPVGSYEIKNLVVEGGGTLRYTDRNIRRLSLTGSITGAGTIDMSANNLAHKLTVGGDFLPATLQQGRATVELNGSSTQKVGSHNYYNLTISGGGDKELQGDITINNTLTLSGAKIILGNHDLIIADGASISGTFSSTNMIVTNGTGRLIKQGNANTDYQMVYPVGTGSYYTPYEISSFTASDRTGSVEVRAVAGAATGSPAAGAKDLQKHWVVSQTGLTVTKANVSFTYNNNEVGAGGNQRAYALRKASGGMWTEPGGTSTSPDGSNPMAASEVNDITGVWTAIEQAPIVTYYTYRSGNWNEVSTWTHNPGGTTQTATDIPGDNARVVVLNGRTVTLTNDVTNTGLSLAIGSGGFVDMSTHQFTNTLTELGGEGTLKLASVNFPTVTDNYLVISVGGTVEYYNATNFTLPSAEVEYNNLILNGNAIVTQKHNLKINGDLLVKKGTYRINDGSAARYRLDVEGDLTVNVGAKVSVGLGNTTNGGMVSGGSGAFTNYYTSNTHTVVVNGNFTNNGTVRFTNQLYPVYNAFPANGAATVYFRGAKDNKLTCNGTTDLYNLVLDKGVDQTFKLTVYSSAYNNFRLFGRNNLGSEGSGANPNIRKALWIRTGTLELTGSTVIPSLSEGGQDFLVPAKGCLLLNGPGVIVLTTANNYAEVNAAYGLSRGTGSRHGVNVGGNQALSIYGKLQVDDGYLSSRRSAGFITWSTASGEFIINGGHVDARQVRSHGSSALSSYNQRGGCLTLRGRRSLTENPSNPLDLSNVVLSGTTYTGDLDNSKGTFSSFMRGNVFVMSGGEIEILDASGSNGYAIDIASDEKNINVSGGTISIKPQTNDNFIIRSNAPFYNFAIVNPGTGNVELQDYSAGGVNIAGDLNVLNNLNLTDGILKTNNHDVIVGGNFLLAKGTNYITGTNRTIFNGDDQQKLVMDLSSNLALNKLVVNKEGGELLLTGTRTTLNVNDSLIVLKGDLNCDAKYNLAAKGHIYMGGRQLGSSWGRISMLGSAPQVISGNDKGEFYYLKLNTGNTISVTTDLNITGKLEFRQNYNLDIGSNNITFSADAIIDGASALRYIKTAGNAGDGGVTFVYKAITPKTWPIGVDSYTPATIGFTSSLSSYGDITLVPVNYEHPTTTTDNQALDYFWRVKSNGFSGIAGKVSHTFKYDQLDVQGGSEANYLPARYDVAAYNWNKGTTSDVDEAGATNQINDWTSPTQSADYIDGDYTAGLSTAFGTPKKYYSRRTGLWKNRSTWSTTGHGGSAGSTIPSSGDIVIIGNGHTVSLERWNNTRDRDKQNCASLQIESGAVLDVTFNPGSNFGMVMSHPSGNGKIRVSARYTDNVAFEFPSGDFSDFNNNSGTTELYTINSTSGTEYYLPDGVKEYGNLLIHPRGGSNVMFPNHDITILGNLTTQGTSAHSWFCPTWYSSGWNPKTITVKGDLKIEGGALIWFENDKVRQDIIVNGDVIVSSGAGIGSSNANNQTLSIGGSLINNSSADLGTGGQRGCYLKDVPLIFFGNNNAKINNTGGVPQTTFGTITVNKGNSAATKLMMDIGGTIDFKENEWLNLQNGTFFYESDESVYLNTNNSFTIPSTAALTINTPRDFILCYGNNNDNDLYLNGKLTVKRGRLYVGNASTNFNRDIEYSGGGSSEIDIKGGQLRVAGQIRRNPASTAGVLKYTQSGGGVIISGRNALTTNAKLEVVNTASQFNMSGGTLTIVSGGGTTFGDLYLRPENSSITGGEIIFDNTGVGLQNYLLDSTVPLNDLTINGSSNNATVKLLLSPLTLNGDLKLSNPHSILDANSTYNIPVTLKGDFNNSGNYSYYENTTTFNGGTQAITGSTAPGFYNLVVNPVTSLTINNTVTVNNDLLLSNGTLAVGANTVNVKGNVVNNATYTSTGNGLVINGLAQQEVSGTGTFGRIELDNTNGANALSNLNVEGELALTNGVFNIGAHLLALGESSDISGTFGTSNMITTNGVYSSKGIQKTIPAGASIFTFPIGVAGKYTPAKLTTTANDNSASVRINTVNDKHPANIDAANILDYFWEVQSIGLNNYGGNLQLTYLDEDINGDDNNYYATRLLVPGTSWSKKNTVTAGTNTINFSLTEDNISGEYTAGNENAFPNNVPQYTSKNDGVWSDASNWEQTAGDVYALTGGPNGFIVVVDDIVTIDQNYAQSYKTTIAAGGKLKIDDTSYGHNLGEVSGSGTLYMESGQLPEAKFDNFLGCGHSATLEYGGDSDYSIIADLYDEAANLIFSGTGKRVLPNKNLTICNQLVIRGAELDNSVNNKKLIIKGSFTRESGSFISGTGSTATVTFNGSAEQNVGGFTGVNARLNNLEVNNSNGLTLSDDVEVGGKLILTNGLINTTDANSLTITNTATDCVTPASGSDNSYVNGPLSKMINQGDSFRFPVGIEGKSGAKIVISAVRPNTKLWTVNYKRPNGTASDFSFPLTAINSHELWQVSTPGGGEAKVQLAWDADSDITPLMTEHGLSDIRVVQYDGAEWQEIASVANGTNTSGFVISDSRIVIPAAGLNVATATVNTNKPKVRFNPDATICGLTSGIKVEISSTVPTSASYELHYSINGVAQTPVTVTSFPYQLATASIGVYQLTGFKYDNKVRTGVVDPASIEVFAEPTAANAGADQILQGKTQATLDANNAVVGVGQWHIVSGTGGSFVDPNIRNTVFNGTTGTTYVLSWIIANGDCESVDEVTIGFPLVTSHTWLGHTNEWNVVSNWEHGILPDASTDVIINAVVAPNVDPVVTDLISVEIKNLTVNAGASLTLLPGSQLKINGDLTTNSNNLIIENTNAKPSSLITNGSVSGKVTMKWTFDNLNWWFIGHGVSDPKMAAYEALRPANDYAMYDYLNNGSWYKASANATTFKLEDQNELKGYLFKVKNTGAEVVHLGELNNDPVYTRPLLDEWQIIANPYPSHYQLPSDPAGTGDFANTEGTVYVTKSTRNSDKIFETFNTNSTLSSPEDFTGILAPSQAFYVKTSTGKAGSDITMRASNRIVDGTKTSLKSGKKKSVNVFRIHLTNESGASDEAVIALRENGQKGFTRMDSEQRFNKNGLSYIYSMVEGNQSVINVLPELNEDFVQELGIKAKSGQHEISVTGLNSLTHEYELILEDKLLGVLHKLDGITSYAFNSDAGTFDERFVLHLNEPKTDVPTGVDGVDVKSSVSILVEGDSRLLVNCKWNESNKKVYVYSVSGIKVLDEAFKGESFSEDLNVKPGIYIVKIQGTQQTYEKKILIK
jgi:hypothetical protein